MKTARIRQHLKAGCGTKCCACAIFPAIKFLRQEPIADFIVDFYCPELRLVIEIDGDSHAESVEYDVARTSVLNAYGISVVRYSNDEVMENIEGVYADLASRVGTTMNG